MLEVETAPSEWPDFLGHLPPASTPTLIEISMEKFVEQATLNKFQSQLQKRDKARKQKSIKEQKYVTKVDLVSEKKFQALKQKSFGYTPASDVEQTNINKIIARQVNEMREETKEQAKPIVDPNKGFFKLQEEEVIKEQSDNVWNQFGKAGENNRQDLALFSLQNAPKPTAKANSNQDDSLSNQLTI